MALIKAYVAQHPDIDPKRIYVGGCSNGGYMALKLILKEPAYFAAGYISAVSYTHLLDATQTPLYLLQLERKRPFPRHLPPQIVELPRNKGCFGEMCRSTRLL